MPVVPDEEVIHCDLCGKPLPTHASYVVQMHVFADPSMPSVTSEEMASANYDESMENLLSQMASMSADELQDQVHRHFEFRLCPNCHANFLSNPLGRPRTTRSGKN